MSPYSTYQVLILHSCEAEAVSLADKICTVMNSSVGGEDFAYQRLAIFKYIQWNLQ